VKFRTTVLLEGKTATGLRVPADVVASFGRGKRPPVSVTINGYTYRSTVAASGDDYLLPLAAEHRAATGVSAGDEIEVELALDDAPREVEVPPDLAAALHADQSAKAIFEGLSYSRQRRIVLGIEGAKAADTRARRVSKSIEDLRAGRA
jgi:hypothetical protein